MSIRFENIFFWYFGKSISSIKDDDVYSFCKTCSERAYRDFCRTIDFGEMDLNHRKQNKENTINYLSEIISELNSIEIEFDNWHKSLCDSIIDAYLLPNGDKIIHYGQAQKWINMTFKYLRIIGVSYPTYEPVMHIPIDNYIIEAASESRNRTLLDDMDVYGLDLLSFFHQVGVDWIYI